MSYSEATLDYFAAHAINPEVASSLGVRNGAIGITYPCVDANGAPTTRIRRLGDAQPKVVGEAGAPLGVTVWRRPQPGKLLLLAEGESDALAACSARPDLAVASIPGVGFPVERLATALYALKVPGVVLALDSDRAGDAFASKAAPAIAQAGMQVRRLRLEPGQDLADVLAAHRPDERAEWLARAIREAVEPPSSNAPLAGVDTFRLYSADDLLKMPPPSWLVDGIVPASGLSILYGESGTGKSFIALDWALCVATGLPWFGHEVKRRPVVYVAAEGKAGLGVRVRAWSYAHGLRDLSLVRFLPEAVNLRDAATIAKARRTLADLPERPGLLVVDTVARTMPGADENAAKDMGEFITGLDGLRHEDAALGVHHSGRDAKHERGSTALRGAADMMCKAARERDRVTLSCDKMKDGPEWPAFALALEPSASSLVLALRVGAVAPADDLAERVLAFVAEHGPCSQNDTEKGVTGKREAIREALQALARTGAITNDGVGWQVRPDGRGAPGRTPDPAPRAEVRPDGGMGPKAPPAGAHPEPRPDEPRPEGAGAPLEDRLDELAEALDGQWELEPPVARATTPPLDLGRYREVRALYAHGQQRADEPSRSGYWRTGSAHPGVELDDAELDARPLREREGRRRAARPGAGGARRALAGRQARPRGWHVALGVSDDRRPGGPEAGDVLPAVERRALRATIVGEPGGMRR
jgi:hypothetical protein